MPLLLVERLSKWFGKVKAVDGLSFEVQEGEIVGLLGPNGAGKTTTLNCIAGIFRPDEGTIRINGYDIVNEPVEAKRHLGYVPEVPTPFPFLSVWEHLEFIARVWDLPDGWQSEAEILMERLGLTEWRDKPGAILPKGVREKTMLACAFLPKPPLLLLDEPIVGIDPIGQHEVKALLWEMRDKGHGILISTHILSFAEEMSDRLIVIDKGRKIAEGKPDELRQKVSLRRDISLEEVFVRLVQEQT